MGHLSFAAIAETAERYGDPFSPQLRERYDLINQGQASELMAQRWQLSRAELDEFSLRSHHRAQQATARGWFDDEIAPVTIDGEVITRELIVAAADAKLALPEVKVGLAAAAGGLLRLPKRIPYHVAMEMVLTGDAITAERAYAIGLVNRVTDPGEARQAALGLAERIAQAGPLALRGSKQVVQRQWDWSEDEGWQAQEEFLAPIFESEDAKEGASAFAEKRVPSWTGR